MDDLISKFGLLLFFVLFRLQSIKDTKELE